MIKFNPRLSIRISIHFWGINFGNKLLIDPALREILYYAIDRNRIIANLLGDFAVVTTCPINPAFLEQDSIEQGTDVKMLLAQNGYGNVNESGTRVKEIDGERIPLQFDLVVCGDGSIKGTVAEYIQNSLASFGIDIRIKNVPYEEYLSRVEEGDFDLFLGEIDLSADYDMERLLKTGGTLNYGEFQDEAMDAVIDQMNSAQSLHQLKEKRKEFEQIFRESCPRFPSTLALTGLCMIHRRCKGLVPK